MNLTTNEVGQQLNESLLNMSTSELAKPSRAHATSKLAKRKLENLLQSQASINHQHQQRVTQGQHQSKSKKKGDNLAYNSFEEGIDCNQLAAHSGQSNTHHSLSMFDNDVSMSKVNNFIPLHH